MKNYLYYATEENCYETEKMVSENVHDDVKGILTDSFINENDAEQIATEIANEYDVFGHAYRELTDGQDYDIIIGVARHGKCSQLSKRITELRRQAIAMCY